MEPQEYCSQKVAPAGSDLYYALLFVPEAQRAALTALHAFRAEVRGVIEECTDPGVARLKLQWWREEAARIARQEAQQPVAKALQALPGHEPPGHEPLTEIIDATELELDEAPGDSLSGVVARQRAIGARLWRLGAAVCGARSPGTQDAASRLGAALAAGAALRNLRTLLQVPSLAPTQARESPEAAPNELRRHLAGVRRELDDAIGDLPGSERPVLLGAVTLARIEAATLAEVERDGCRVFERHISLTPLRKLWIARRTRALERRRAGR